MNNETARERLKLVVQLREASERHLQISRDFDDQALEINEEIEAYFASQNARIEASEAVRRPVSLQVMSPLPQPNFERVAAAATEDRLRVEAGTQRRRRTSGDRADPINHTPEVAENRRSWRRIFVWWTARSAEPGLPAGY